jgi:hypothetical protein
MLSFSRLAARQARVIFRRALGLSTRGPGPPVVFTTEGRRLMLRARTAQAAVEYCLAQDVSLDTPIVAPFDLLADCEGGRNEPVTLELTGDGRIKTSWGDGNAPQACFYDPASKMGTVFPPFPRRQAKNPPPLLTALREAMAIANPDIGRFALGCIQLRGGKGQIVATDSRQLLVQGGFEFPWKGELLVPRTLAFACAALPTDEPVQVGADDAWLTVQVGPWRICLAIEKESRFPRVDEHIRPAADAKTVVQFAEPDAEFLAGCLPKLPGNDESLRPVTIELNGEVAVRSADEQGHVTEAKLSGSSYTGEPLRLSSNRDYLAEALRLGFRELCVFSPETPVQCQAVENVYLWAVLDKDGIVPASENATRIESPLASDAPIPPNKPRKEQQVAMTQSSVVRASPAQVHGSHNQNGSADGVSIETLIEQAEAVKNSLRDAAGQVGELIVALKRHRKNSKTLQTALSSIRQLQTLDV